MLLELTKHLPSSCDLNALVRTSRYLHESLNLYLYHHDAQSRDWLWAGFDSTEKEFCLKSIIYEWPSTRVAANIYFRNDGCPINLAVFHAIKWGHDEIVHLFLKHSIVEWTHIKAPNGLNICATNLFHEAVRYNRLAMLPYLVEHGCDVNEKYPFQKYAEGTPLHVACYLGHVEIARYLLENGADPRAHAFGSITPLQWAMGPDCRYGWGRKGRLVKTLQIVELLNSYGVTSHDSTQNWPDWDLVTQCRIVGPKPSLYISSIIVLLLAITIRSE